jgi:hypothetical protein
MPIRRRFTLWDVSKKYKGKPCVYCVEATATTADHVIGRNFFLATRRDSLPIVPACQQCNREKARLEDYLMVVLGFGGRHPDATVNLDTLVRKRLEKNAKLRAELKAGFERSGGTAIPLDHVRLNKLFAMIATGLLWYHWQVLLGEGYSAIAAIFLDSGRPFFDQMLSGWRTPNRVTVDLGQGTFSYQGAQATDSPQTSIWSFSMYCGVTFGGDPKIPGPASLSVAVTGPEVLIQKLRSGIFAEDVR